jgi:hypothetical protein
MDSKSIQNFKKSFNRKRAELGYGPQTTLDEKIAYLSQYTEQVAKRARKDGPPAQALSPAPAATPDDPAPLVTSLVIPNTP